MPPGRDRVFLWDDSLSGFGVTAMASGRRVYVVQFRQNGRSRRMKLGLHGRLTPDEARSMAKEVLGAVECGKDPIWERREKRQIRTFREVAEDFLRIYVARRTKPRTLEQYEGLLRLHLYPALGSRPIASITRGELARVHAAITGQIVANRCLALFDTVWNWAVKMEEIRPASTPSKGIDRNRERSRERYLTLTELRRLGAALRAAETVGLPWTVNENGPKAKHLARPEKRVRLIDVPAVAAIRLLMLTGARLREILGARWDYVDLDRGVMFLPDSKTGRKTIYLSDAAIAVLDGITRVEGNPYIIVGGKEGGHRTDLKRPWEAIIRAAGLEAKEGEARLRLHDLRHTFASVGVGGSLGLPLVGKLLGHSQARTTQRYAHLDADPLRKAANMIGSQITDALEGSAPVVLTLPHRARDGEEVRKYPMQFKDWQKVPP